MTRYIALAADHAGFPLKTELLARFKAQGYQVIDVAPSHLTLGTTILTTRRRLLVQWCRVRPGAPF